MAFTYKEIYADESRIDGGGPFFFGALVASPRRIEILRDRVKQFRAASGCVAEMKWTKVSNAYLEKYKQFVDVVLQDPHVQVFVREIRRDSSWHGWNRTPDERFWIAYYSFLRARTHAYSRYNIVLDYKDGKRHRWTKLRFSMNETARNRLELKKAQVRSLEPRSSHGEDILQLVDVLLGALTSCATSTAKVSLSEYVRSATNAHFDVPWSVDLTKVKRFVRRRVGQGRSTRRRADHRRRATMVQLSFSF